MSHPGALRWLITLDPSPDHALRWMLGTGRVLVPLGHAVSAVRTTGHQGLRAAARVPGPAVHHERSGHVFHLVPPDAEWTSAAGTLLGVDHWLALPAPEVLEPPGTYWLSPPDGTGTLTDLAALAEALTPQLPAEAVR
ncbi:hypothetical protein GR131_16125 [Streptomyces sp. GF20]|uniref:hypothetical protein n=1 Tax=Streptomyces sp. GF20 TaxID=2692235 RepID=UPI0013193EB0|nr:hypothetical protein [Streptomyces sp. GF20]QHC16851.1 hypothetical protein GR131_16125 [Streptomyces sp. GF20]